MSAEIGSITAARKAIADKAMSAREATSASLEAISETDDALNAVVASLPEKALAQATSIDQAGVAGPLAGIPILLKDNICLEWGGTTCASRMLEGYESPFTATAARKLVDAGAVIVGKANMDEFAMGSSGEHSCFGPTRNPWDTDRVPGGSSAGSAAAVAAGVVPAALGSDTGGSIRQPASLCGVVGLKPTYGRVSRWGLVAYASSLDQIGPIAHTVEDCALLLDVISGFDPLDSTSVEGLGTNCHKSVHEPLAGVRLGVPREARSEQNSAAVGEAFESVIQTYTSLGASIVDIELPRMEHAVAAYYVVALAEASSNLARYDGIRYGHRAEAKPGEDLIDLYCRSRSEGLGAEVQRRIMLGTYALSSGYYDAYYLRAMKVRRLIRQDFDAAFERCDGIIMPTAPEPAYRIGEKMDDPWSMYLGDYYTVAANMAGLPAISVPCGVADIDGSRLPIGFQVYCPAFEEERLLRIARMYERERGEFERAPSR